MGLPNVKGAQVFVAVALALGGAPPTAVAQVEDRADDVAVTTGDEVPTASGDEIPTSSDVVVVPSPPRQPELGGAHRRERALQAFERAERALAAFEGAQLRASTVEELVEQVLAMMRRAGAIAREYQQAFEVDRSRTITAMVGTGRAYESVARAIRSFDPSPSSGITLLDDHPAPWPPPSASPPAPELLGRMPEELDPMRRSMECAAVARYVIAARAARLITSLEPSATLAFERLAAFGDERIAECIEVARAGDPTLHTPGDPTFSPYTPGEFYVARPGLTLTPLDGYGAARIETDE